jgi:manganese/zinc/iron transport system permease protein
MDLSLALRNVLIGATVLGAMGGIVGCFAFLRRQSLLGDALAHAALPGVCLAFLITGTRETLPLFFGALLAGLAGALVILGVVRFSRVKEDAAMGLVLSVFFGFGIVLLTFIQKLPWGNQSGLDSYLFGQAATLLTEDVVLMAIVGAVVLVVVALFYKELKLLCFDRAYAASLGLPIRTIEIVLTLLLVTVVVVGLRTVGVVLIIATIVTPAAVARQWTDRLGVMLALAALVGASSGAAGAVASAVVPRLPTGPSIVVLASLALVVSLLFAPRRGIVWAKLRERAVMRRVRRENLLKDLYRIGERNDERFDAPVPWPVIMGVRGQPSGQLRDVVRELLHQGFVVRSEDAVALTDRGRAAAQNVVRKHRLWELYLTRKLELASESVHRDAEQMEHALTDADVADLEARLGHPSIDPHGRPIPPKTSEAGTPDTSGATA